MPAAKPRKRKASTPAWEICSNREMADYSAKVSVEDYGTYSQLQSLLERFLKSPSSLNHNQEEELDKRLKLMTHYPPHNKEKLQTICALAIDGSDHALRVLVYLTDPQMVGKDR